MRCPSFLDTCLVHFLLSDIEINGRQHAVVRVFALRGIEQLDVLEHVLPSGLAGRVRPSSDALPLQELEEALGDGVVVAVPAPA